MINRRNLVIIGAYVPLSGLIPDLISPIKYKVGDWVKISSCECDYIEINTCCLSGFDDYLQVSEVVPNGVVFRDQISKEYVRERAKFGLGPEDH
jgi:hypothetical protein